MDVDLNSGSGLTLSFATEEELEEFLDEMRVRSAFLAPLPSERTWRATSSCAPASEETRR